jgi:Domain of unknown function (DUF6473)
MTYEIMRGGTLDYQFFRHGRSRLRFRGPAKDGTAPYVAFVGGTETFGKFIPDPFPRLVEGLIGTDCVNLGLCNAGLDAHLSDPDVAELIAAARLRVFQIIGAQNMSNRFYTVHRRRNDRFVSARTPLRLLYPEVDFADFHFTRHMLMHLHRTGPRRVAMIRRELQGLWEERMRSLLRAAEGPSVLFWFARGAPPQRMDRPGCAMTADPMFVTRGMVDRVARDATALTEVVISGRAAAGDVAGMHCDEMDLPAAASMLGVRAHREAAEALAQTIRPLM